MKKILLISTFVFIAIASISPCFAVNFGTYKTETEYGLIDGFKWSFFDRKKGEPMVQLKSETEEEKIRIEKNKNKPKEEVDEVQMYKFMLDNTVLF